MEEDIKQQLKYLIEDFTANDNVTYDRGICKLFANILNRLEQLEKTLDENTTEHIATVNRLQELEKELEPIHKTGLPVEVLLAEWGRLEDLEDDTDCLKHRIKELEKENKELKYDNATLEKQVKLMRDNFIIAVEQQVNRLLGGSNE